MSTDFQENGHDTATVPVTATTPGQNGGPTETLVASAVGDRCVNCGSTLSSDQRYCVICGERRGTPRFTLPAAAVAGSATTTTSSRGGRPRLGSGATLIAGVGTLLLALLVGFLIGNAAGRNNTKTVTASSPAIKVVNVGGGNTGSAGTATSSSANSTAKTSSRSDRSRTKAARTAPKKTSSAESNAAAKVTGGNGAPPASTKVGQKCTGSQCSQSGYNKKTHKFDGSFFGQ